MCSHGVVVKTAHVCEGTKVINSYTPNSANVGHVSTHQLIHGSQPRGQIRDHRGTENENNKLKAGETHRLHKYPSIQNDREPNVFPALPLEQPFRKPNVQKKE